MNNTSIGNSKEQDVCNLFRTHGYWAHAFAKGRSGSQPVDIVAVRGGKTVIVWLLDAKNVRKEEPSFSLSRIEPNQWATLAYAHDFAKIDLKYLGFAIFFERMNEFYWLSYEKALDMNKTGIKSVNFHDLRKFEEVLNEYDN